MEDLPLLTSNWRILPFCEVWKCYHSGTVCMFTYVEATKLLCVYIHCVCNCIVATKLRAPEDLSAVADHLGVSAIVVQDLKYPRMRPYTFHWDRMLTFTGDTGACVCVVCRGGCVCIYNSCTRIPLGTYAFSRDLCTSIPLLLGYRCVMILLMCVCGHACVHSV